MILKLHYCSIFLVAFYYTIVATDDTLVDSLQNINQKVKEDVDETYHPREKRTDTKVIRMCGHESCDPDRYAALTQALCGYNIITGEPYTLNAGEKIDPGIRNQIFNPTKTVEGLKSLTGVTALNTMICSASAFSEVVTNVRDFQRKVAETSSQSTGFGFHRSADVEAEPTKGTKIKTKVELKAEASFTNSKEMGRVKKFFESSKGAIVMTQAQCLTNRISLHMFKLPPFTEAFRHALISLSEASAKDENWRRDRFKQFIQQYGTHFIQSSSLGAKIMVTTFLKESAKEDFTSDNLKKCAGRNFNVNFLGAKLDHQSNECSQQESEELKKGSSDVEDQVTVTRGSKPSSGVGEWAQQIFKPEVLRMELKPIVNLLSDDILKKQAGLMDLIDAPALRQWFVPMYDQVCTVNGWNCEIPKGCGFTDNCKYNQDCVDVNKELGTFECEALDLCKKRNGGCDHKCAMSGNTVTCSCNSGYKLKSDKKSCEGLKYAVVAKNTDCWKMCKWRSGQCDKCGADGFCCRYGNSNCPADLARVATHRHHTCVLHTTQKKVPIRIRFDNCYYKCSRKGGLCTSFCGKGGYCCRKGSSGCDVKLQSVARSDMHICVGYIADKGMGIGESVQGGTIACWNGCGKRGGKCSVCGSDGYCCRRGHMTCPIELQAAARFDKHTCVKYRKALK